MTGIGRERDGGFSKGKQANFGHKRTHIGVRFAASNLAKCSSVASQVPTRHMSALLHRNQSHADIREPEGRQISPELGLGLIHDGGSMWFLLVLLILFSPVSYGIAPEEC